ncbi:hypothetical protein AB0P17_06115 [Streptomyces sp. NPDC088124]|uniref:hypothetical protein n=1 Tax=Streptomyces sp. NPDC088124 TaxID=3154654 RepID=UPI0034322EAA
MSIRRTTKSRRGVAVAATAAVLALTVAGCGGGDDDAKAKETASSAKSSGSSTPQAGTAAGDEVDPNAKLAVVKGAGGMEYVINSVVRDGGGFVTVTGQMKNTSDKDFFSVSSWRGNEKELLAGNGDAVSGGTLVDVQGKKRYYVLRDTDGRCLCTTGVSSVDAGESVPVFMQFPAPPAGTTAVDFSLPTFATTSIKISG